MKIGIDNTQIDLSDERVYLGQYIELDEKYVHAVDNKIDVLITTDKKTAQYFTENGIPSLVMLK